MTRATTPTPAAEAKTPYDSREPARPTAVTNAINAASDSFQGRPPIYDFAAIEEKWRARWEAQHLYQPDLHRARRPYYNLMMFPYPSAEGLHVGNTYAYIGSDAHGRFMAMRGYDVFEPIGFDAFGIHSENFAIKQGVHPRIMTALNVERFRRQLEHIGNRFDWSHEVQTTDPAYYRWTQWIFVQLFKAGLVERRKGTVNWCPKDKTVLADEQVIAGRCERCGTLVEQRELEQWAFKISKYADRLLNNLDKLDWSERVRTAQRAWIGRSEGLEIRFPVQAPAEDDEINRSGRGGRRGSAEEKSARASTHQAHNGAAEAAIADSHTSVPSASAAVNPVSVPFEIPIYTTRPDTIFGATFIVLAPEHPLVERITDAAHRDAINAYRQQAKTTRGRAYEDAEKSVTGAFTGAYAIHPLSGERLPIWIADYVLMEYGTGAIMAVPAHDARDLAFAHAMGLPVRVVIVPEQRADTTQLQAGEDESFTDDGVLIGSGEWSGLPSAEARAAIIAWFEAQGRGQRAVTYHLRDWLISRQRYWGPPIPIIYCPDHGAVPVPEDQLPVLLPETEDYLPQETGSSPLAAIESFVNTSCPICGQPARRETDVSDNFLDSAWYFLRYPSSNDNAEPWNPMLTRKWLPTRMYIGGAEHSVLHMMYARFITMALHDLGHLDFEEPFPRFRANGTITANGEKMSKSRGNVIRPDGYLERFGADVFRTYLLFMGPYEGGGDFSDRGMGGVVRFLDRVWQFVARRATSLAKGKPQGEAARAMHQLIQRVTDDMEAIKYNTAVAALMKYFNALESQPSVTRAEVVTILLLLAPFAPFITEELWERIGGKGFIHAARWPAYDAEMARPESVTIVVQVNGRVRDRITVAADTPDDDVTQQALAAANVARILAGRQPRQIIYVPGRIVNVVVG